jgi:hypothetical protein
MSKSSNGNSVKPVQVSFQFPRNPWNAAIDGGAHAVKSPQSLSFAATSDESCPHPSPHLTQNSSHAKNYSSKTRLVSSEQLLRSPSEGTGQSNGNRGRATLWDAQTSSLPLGVALLLRDSPDHSEDRSMSRTPALDPLPFSKSRARHFVMERMSSVITGAHSPTLIPFKDLNSQDASESHSISAPTNRSEAVLLADTYRMLREQLQRDSGVRDLFEAAESHAEHGKIDVVWKMLGEEMGIAVSTLSELCRQVRCECAERGDLLELVGIVLQRIVSILHHCNVSCAKEIRGSSKNLAEAANRERMLQHEIDDLKDQLADKEKLLLKYHSKIMDSGVSLAVSESQSRSAKEQFENIRRLINLIIFSCFMNVSRTCIHTLVYVTLFC